MRALEASCLDLLAQLLKGGTCNCRKQRCDSMWVNIGAMQLSWELRCWLVSHLEVAAGELAGQRAVRCALPGLSWTCGLSSGAALLSLQ